MLERITPVVLTLNEAPNIGRTLACLDWAKEVIVVDSLSVDGTAEIAKSFPNTRVVEHAFTSHEQQWRFAIESTGITSEWILRLDADYVLTSETIEEIAALAPGDDVGGYLVGFRYCVDGRPLRASLYPPNMVLFRPDCARPHQDGHTERWDVDGTVLTLHARILHDDRKPMSDWFAAQCRYMALERDKLLAADRRSLRLRDRIRLTGAVAPALVLLHCLFGKGLILDGRAGVFYSFQRAIAEFVLTLYLLERKLSGQ